MSEGRFRCIHCGDRFDLTGEDLQNFDEGFTDSPYCCDDCFDILNNQNYNDCSNDYSDADYGL